MNKNNQDGFPSWLPLFSCHRDSYADCVALFCLRCLEPEGLILGGQGCDLIVGQEVQDCPGVGVLVLQNVTGAGIYH